MEIEQEKQGECAPSTAQNEEQQDDYRVVDEETSDKEENKTENEVSDDGEPATNEDDISEDNAERNAVIKFSGAARKKYNLFLAMGMSEKEARTKALQPIEINKPVKGVKRAPDVESDSSPKKAKSDERRHIKVCVVLDTFPEEKLTEEQSKYVQESIMDQILEMGTASSIKPKFLNSFFQDHGLTIICADQTTVDWLKIIAPTLRPWDGALLKVLENDEMPHPFTYVGFFPESKDYSDEKVIKLLEAQNESFQVQTWKIIKRETIDSELQVTFTVDRKYTKELRKAGCIVSYKFGKVQLWPKTKKVPLKMGDTNNPNLGSNPTFQSFRGGSPGRPVWRGGGSRGRDNWRGNPSSRSGSLRRGGGFGGSPSRGGFGGSPSRGGHERGGFRGGHERGGFRGGNERGGFRGGHERGGFRGGHERGGFRGDFYSREGRNKQNNFRGNSSSSREGMSWKSDSWKP